MKSCSPENHSAVNYGFQDILILSMPLCKMNVQLFLLFHVDVDVDVDLFRKNISYT